VGGQKGGSVYDKRILEKGKFQREEDFIPENLSLRVEPPEVKSADHMPIPLGGGRGGEFSNFSLNGDGILGKIIKRAVSRRRGGGGGGVGGKKYAYFEGRPLCNGDRTQRQTCESIKSSMEEISIGKKEKDAF